MTGHVNKAILNHLKENDEWITCEQLADKLSLNILSVRSSIGRFNYCGKVILKKTIVVRSTNTSRLYFYKIKSENVIDIFLRVKL